MKNKSRINSIKILWKKSGKWIGLACLLLFAWMIFLYIYKGVIETAANSPVTTSAIMVSSEDKCYFTAENGRLEIAQGFFSTVDEMMGLRLVVETTPEVTEIQRVEAHVLLLDGETKEILIDKDVSTTVLTAGYLPVYLDEPLQGIENKYYELRITFTGDNVNKLRIPGTTNALYETWASSLNDHESPGALRIDQSIKYGSFIIPLYAVFVFVFSAFLIVFFLMVFVKKCKIERVYLLTVLVLGVIYCFVIIPFAVPDEAMHASTAYRISNDFMGIGDTGEPDTIYKRRDDAAVQLNNDCDLYQYYIVYDQMFSMAEDTTLEASGYRDTGVSWILYAPAVLGLIIGRLFGLGSVPMYMLARLLSLLAFSLLTWCAMKKLPFAKTALFVVCILPVTLQQAASMSYDAMAMSIAILFVAYCFSMAFSESKLKNSEMIVSAILGILLIAAKSGAYIPLIALFVMIPAAKFGSARSKWLRIGVFCGLLLLVFIIKNIGLVAGDATSGALNGTASENYTLGYILRNPGVIFNVGVGTLLLNTGYYISTMIGQRLGFLNIILDDVVVYAYLFLLGLSVLSMAEYKAVITIKQKWLIFIGIAGSCALILLSMWLFITPKDSGVIMGVQGRYFIPLLWPALMLLKNKVIVLKRQIDSGILLGAAALHILVFAYIFRDVLLP